MGPTDFRSKLSLQDSRGSDNQATTVLDMKNINRSIKKDQDAQLSVKNQTPIKPIDIGSQNQPRVSATIGKHKFLTGGHKRTLSGVVADVKTLNNTKITNKEYAFADLIGDINYMNDEIEGPKEESKEETVLTKKQLAQMKKQQ